MSQSAKAYSFYPVNNSDDEDNDNSDYSYSNGYLFERKRLRLATSTTSTSITGDQLPGVSHTHTDSQTQFDTQSERDRATCSSNFLPTDRKFCKCGNCPELKTMTNIERKCCTEECFDLTNFQDENYIFKKNSQTCVLSSALLTREVLGKVSLQLQWFRQQRYLGLRGDSLLFSNMSNRNYRYNAYRSYIDFVHGYLGRKTRRVIPACVVGYIRECWPDPDGAYVGFKPVEEADEELPDEDELEQFVMDGGN